jgi:hypothetical protein
MNKKIKSEANTEKFDFVIKTENNSFSQYLMKSSQKHDSISNMINSSFSVFTEAIYDVYTLNESFPEQNTDLYTKKYKTVIIVNSQCFSFDKNENNTDCKLNKYLDLTIEKTNNSGIRRIEENEKNEEIKEEIKELILPICIIEHTDNNIIFSVTCPENLSENLKNSLISAFQSIKPISAKENYKDYNLARYKTNKVDNKIIINIYDKRCDDSNKNYICETIRNVITDRFGNIKNSNKINLTILLKI